MRVLLLTNEYPPHIYGGAGVHVEYLSRELAKLTPVEVRSFHNQESLTGQLKVKGTKLDNSLLPGCPPTFASPLRALLTSIAFNGQGIEADVVHCHTWYVHFGGILAKILYGLPLVITVHSLEPLRPWKREQLGAGYDLSAWVERTALEMADKVIAVSPATRDDVLRHFNVKPERIAVIPNGIDTDEYKPTVAPEVLTRYGIDPARPYVLFIGRMTRQKGLLYLLKAIRHLDPSVQAVLCAGDADTPEMRRELEGLVDDLKATRQGVIWIPEMVTRQTTIVLYSHAAVFCCPSIYEPFGIINLEAMACGTAVVASAVGGIPGVVVDGETGFLVDPNLTPTPPHDPVDGDDFAHRLATAIDRVAGDAVMRERMGQAGRQRVIDHFSWTSIAHRTLDLYQSLKST